LRMCGRSRIEDHVRFSPLTKSGLKGDVDALSKEESVRFEGMRPSKIRGHFTGEVVLWCGCGCRGVAAATARTGKKVRTRIVSVEIPGTDSKSEGWIFRFDVARSALVACAYMN
jgi:hypothetical protein